MNQELQNYVNQARQAGESDDIIKINLKSAGWSEADVAGVFGNGATSVGVTGMSIVAKVVIVCIATVVLVSGGYYLYSRNSNTVVLSPKNTNYVEVEIQDSSGNAQCEPFLSVAEIGSLFGSTYVSYDLSSVGINGEKVITCVYGPTDSTKPSFTFVVSPPEDTKMKSGPYSQAIPTLPNAYFLVPNVPSLTPEQSALLRQATIFTPNHTFIIMGGVHLSDDNAISILRIVANR